VTVLEGVRGEGFWHEIVLTSPAAMAVEAATVEAVFLVTAVQPGAIRLAPPPGQEART
jgi:acetylornithine aminotransferase